VSEPQFRIEVFAKFFKRFMGISTVVTAALPIPVTAFRLISTYGFQTKILSVYTSLFCFLTFAFLFFSRDKFASWLFPQFCGTGRTLGSKLARLLPLFLIVGSLVCVFMYQSVLAASIAAQRTRGDLPTDQVTDEAILQKGLVSQTPEATYLMICYLGIFVLAESAFVLMALKEHLQDSLLLSEGELLIGRRAEADKPT